MRIIRAVNRRPETFASSLLEDAVDIPVWLHEDRATSFAGRSHRDRLIGLAIDNRDASSRVRRWWQRIRASGGKQEPYPAGRQLVRARALVSALVLLVGVTVGVAVAAGALSYDGQHPVNIVTALSLLLVLPLIFLATSLIIVPRRLPGFGGLQRFLAEVSVGNVACTVATRLAPVLAEGLAVLAVAPARRDSAARLGKWQMLLWSQLAGLSFGAGALVTCFALVVFTDLAFGWSTTLAVDSRAAMGIIDTISLPWSAWLPSGVPSAELIDISRFYRLESGSDVLVPAARLTGWWPFLVATLVVYGMGPRAIMLVVAATRVRAATRDLLLHEPEVRALIDRMDTPAVVLDGAAVRNAPTLASEPWVEGRVEPSSVSRANSWRVLIWNESLTGELRSCWPKEFLDTTLAPLDVGGGNTLVADLGVLGNLEATSERGVAVLTKAWEPPLGDFRDFVTELRSHVGRQVSIMVVPIGLGGSTATAEELVVWRYGIASLVDPALYVEGLGR